MIKLSIVNVLFELTLVFSLKEKKPCQILIIILTGLLYSKPKSLAVVSNLSKNFYSRLTNPPFYRRAKVTGHIYLAKSNSKILKKKF